MCYDVEPINFPKFECGDVPEFNFHRVVSQKHYELLTEVLKMVLKRDITHEDTKRITVYRYPHIDPLNYELAFDGVLIGKVVFNLEGAKITITFHPDKRFSIME